MTTRAAVVADRDTATREYLASVMDEWRRLGSEEPWHPDPERYGVDAIMETIHALIDVAIWSGSEDASERLIRSAARHGAQRRAQNTGDDALLREYHALRTAIWRVLRRSKRTAAQAIAELLRLDIAMTLATDAAIRSYHRESTQLDAAWEVDVLRQVRAASHHLRMRLADWSSS